MTSLIQIAVTGEVNSGKSTLVGRLLHETKSIASDKMSKQLEGSSNLPAFSKVTDSLESEREKNITMSASYHYIRDSKFQFVIADTPGHLEYLPNTITGLSESAVVIHLIDATSAFDNKIVRKIAVLSHLKKEKIIVAINKIEKSTDPKQTFDDIKHRYEKTAAEFNLDIGCILPISAQMNKNITATDYQFSSDTYLLDQIINTGTKIRNKCEEFIMPIQIKLEERFAGRIISGKLRVGDKVKVISCSGEEEAHTIKKIYQGKENLDQAVEGQSVSVRVGQSSISDVACLSSTNIDYKYLAKFSTEILCLNDLNSIKHNHNIQCFLTGRQHKIESITIKKSIVDDLIFQIDIKLCNKALFPSNNLQWPTDRFMIISNHGDCVGIGRYMS